MTIKYKILGAENKAQYIDSICRLRIDLFCEFPYLYEGNMEYERHYIGEMAESKSSVIYLAFAGEKVVGVATTLLLADVEEAIVEPFVKLGVDPAKTMYVSEMLILDDFRSCGVYQHFTNEIKSYAASRGFGLTAATVDRPADHPLRPIGYRSPDMLFSRSGFVKHPDFKSHLKWEQVDSEGKEVENTMSCWVLA